GSSRGTSTPAHRPGNCAAALDGKRNPPPRVLQRSGSFPPTPPQLRRCPGTTAPPAYSSVATFAREEVDTNGRKGPCQAAGQGIGSAFKSQPFFCQGTSNRHWPWQIPFELAAVDA